MTDFLVDTVAFVRYLEDRLPAKADKVFGEAEAGRAHLLLPQMALAEFIYITLRGRLKRNRPELHLRDVLHNLTASAAFTISAMPPEAWEVLLELRIPELHDRMIAAEAIARNIPVLTSDPAFRDLKGLSTIW